MNDSHVTWNGKVQTGTNKVTANSVYPIVEILEEMKIEVTQVKTVRENLALLEHLDVGAFAGFEPSVSRYVSNSDHFGEVIKLTPAISQESYYFVFSYPFMEKNIDLTWKLWDRIAEIREGVIINRMPVYEKIQFNRKHEHVEVKY